MYLDFYSMHPKHRFPINSYASLSPIFYTPGYCHCQVTPKKVKCQHCQRVNCICRVQLAVWIHCVYLCIQVKKKKEQQQQLQAAGNIISHCVFKTVCVGVLLLHIAATCLTNKQPQSTVCAINTHRFKGSQVNIFLISALCVCLCLWVILFSHLEPGI